MRLIFLFAAALLIVGGTVARFADRTVASRPSVQAATRPPEQSHQQQSSAGSRSLVVSSNRQGHFQVDASVDGRQVDFMIDTGASMVVLRESDAARVGIRPSQNEYSATVSTANGKVRAAQARLNRVEIGDIRLYDVAALVLPDEALSQNLLGVSFLSRLRRYEYANGRMVLEQ